MCVCECVCGFECIYVYMYVCVYVCVCLCMYVFVCFYYDQKVNNQMSSGRLMHNLVVT